MMRAARPTKFSSYVANSSNPLSPVMENEQSFFYLTPLRATDSGGSYPPLPSSPPLAKYVESSEDIMRKRAASPTEFSSYATNNSSNPLPLLVENEQPFFNFTPLRTSGGGGGYPPPPPPLSKYAESSSRSSAFRVAALCKCALCPTKFDNYLFWDLVYETREAAVEKSLDKLEFNNGTQLPILKNGVLLYRSANDLIHYFACWPNLDSVLHALYPLFENNKLKNTLIRCYLGNKAELGQYLDKYFTNLSNTRSNSHPPPNNALGDGGGNSGPLTPPFFNGTDDNNPPYDGPYNNATEDPLNDGLSNTGGNPPPLLPGYVGKEINFRSSSYSLWLKLLAGLIAAAGVTALILTMAVLNPPITATTIAVGVLGTVALLTSVGLFAKACTIPTELTIPPPPNQPSKATR